MRALKGLLVYIGIVFGIVFAIGIVLFAIMYFVPTFKPMGVGVVHGKQIVGAETIKLENYSGYSQVQFNISSKKIEVRIIPEEERTNIDVGLNYDVLGLVFDITEFNVNKQVFVEDGILKVNLNTTEPSGLFKNSGTGLYVKIPSSLECMLAIKTESGIIALGNNKQQLKMSQLNIITKTGNVEFGKIAGEDNELHLSNLSLTTDTGKFDLSGVETIKVDNLVKLRAKDGDFKFKNLVASVDVKGSGILINAETIKCGNEGFTFLSENGYFNIGTINSQDGVENTIVTENCDIKINSIFGKTGIVTTYGDITIGTLNSNSMIESTHGNVTINKAIKDVSIRTEYGNIKVSDYQRNGKFVSHRGDMDLTCTSEYQDKVYTNIANTDGNINLTNKVNKVIINTDGRSQVKFTLQVIKTELDLATMFQHSLEISNQGSCNVYLPTKPVVNFRYMAKGNISGEYLGKKMVASDAYQYFPDQNTPGANFDETCEFIFNGVININQFSSVSA